MILCFFPCKTGTVTPTQLPCRAVNVSWEAGHGNTMQMQVSVLLAVGLRDTERQDGPQGLDTKPLVLLRKHFIGG